MYTPPRCLLFVPGQRRDFLDKASRSGADALVLDLEDSVPPDLKDSVRAEAPGILAELEMPAFVRINPMRGSTDFAVPCGEEDLSAVIGCKPAGVVVPKVETSGDLLVVDSYMRACERAANGAPGSTDILAIVETARGILALQDITTARLDRNVCLVFGSGDFTGDLGIEWTDSESETAWPRTLLPIACRAAGYCAPIDGVHANIKDLAGLRQNALNAKSIGYQAKIAIHPAQVPVIQEVFTPSEDEVSWAQRVMAGLKEAEAKNLGAFTLDGRMIDYPVIQRAERILDRSARLRHRP